MIPIKTDPERCQGLDPVCKIGEAGAYTVSGCYHRFKLLNQAQKDPNHIRNIVGGYTFPSAAQQFSLNKVAGSPEWNEYLDFQSEIDKNKVDEILKTV